MLRSYDDAVVDAGQLMGARADVERSPAGLKSVIGLSDFPNRFGELEPRSYDFELIGVVFVKKGGRHAHSLSIIGGNSVDERNLDCVVIHIPRITDLTVRLRQLLPQTRIFEKVVLHRLQFEQAVADLVVHIREP